jgi:hypothetical protein
MRPFQPVLRYSLAALVVGVVGMGAISWWQLNGGNIRIGVVAAVACVATAALAAEITVLLRRSRTVNVGPAPEPSTAASGPVAERPGGLLPFGAGATAVVTGLVALCGGLGGLTVFGWGGAAVGAALGAFVGAAGSRVEVKL